MLMGSLDQKMLIAFRCYDVDGDESIDADEIRLVMKNVPLFVEGRYGESFAEDNMNLNRVEYMAAKNEDNEQIDLFIDTLLNHYPDGMYFDEFKTLCNEVTSELFLCVYDCIYQYIPCVRNFLVLRNRYKMFLESKECRKRTVTAKLYSCKILMPPITKKMVDRISEFKEEFMRD